MLLLRGEMRIPLLLAIVLCSGCVHQAVHVTPPDPTRMQDSSRKVAAQVVAAKASIKQANEALNDAKASHQAEMAKLQELAPKVDYIFSIAPQELKPLVAEVQLQVAGLNEAQMATSAKQDVALAKIVDAYGLAEQANAGSNEAQKYSGAYVAETEAMAKRYQAAEDARAKDSKALAYYRLHWLIGWIVLVGGIAACVLVVVLKFTARGAAIAARF